VLNTVKKFIQFWEASECNALQIDCERKIRAIKRDMTEVNEHLAKTNEEIEKRIEERVTVNAEQYVDDEQKHLDTTMFSLNQ